MSKQKGEQTSVGARRRGPYYWHESTLFAWMPHYARIYSVLLIFVVGPGGAVPNKKVQIAEGKKRTRKGPAGLVVSGSWLGLLKIRTEYETKKNAIC